MRRTRPSKPSSPIFYGKGRVGWQTAKYDIYEKVWVIDGGVPKHMTVRSVYFNHRYCGEIAYGVSESDDVYDVDYKEKIFDEKVVFPTKEELIKNEHNN